MCGNIVVNLGREKRNRSYLFALFLTILPDLSGQQKLAVGMGCRSTPSGRRRARDVVVSPVCAKPYALKRGRSRGSA